MGHMVLMIAVVILAGCSTVEIRRADSSSTDGLRFYRPDPYLLVTADKDGNQQTTIIMLPNRREEYIIRPVARLGTVDVQATLDGGWNLTNLGSTIDTKIPETITALTGVLQAVPGLAGLRTSVPVAPGLYRLEFDPATGVVTHLTPVRLPGS